MVLFEPGGISAPKSFLNFDFNEERRRNPWPVRTVRLYGEDDPGDVEAARGDLTWEANPLAIPVYSRSFWRSQAAELLFGSCWASGLGYL
ncbi:hypothetical protein ERO13_A12G043640v2 [Gossypium hirsutum]|nr:hypothetical protein ERO13_A12G043640v2 [Gossypium hirsutum]